MLITTDNVDVRQLFNLDIEHKVTGNESRISKPQARLEIRMFFPLQSGVDIGTNS